MNGGMTIEIKSEEVIWLFRAACESTEVAVRAFREYRFREDEMPAAGQPYYFGNIDEYIPKALRFESERCLVRLLHAMDLCLNYDDSRFVSGLHEVADVLESLDPKGFESEINCCRRTATVYTEYIDMLNNSEG